MMRRVLIVAGAVLALCAAPAHGLSKSCLLARCVEKFTLAPGTADVRQTRHAIPATSNIVVRVRINGELVEASNAPFLTLVYALGDYVIHVQAKQERAPLTIRSSNPTKRKARVRVVYWVKDMGFEKGDS